MIQFEVGQIFQSICYNDSDLKILWEVTKRTAKTITVRDTYGGQERTRRVKFYSNKEVESICPDPAGFTYISADEPVNQIKEVEIAEEIEIIEEPEFINTIETIPTTSQVTVVNDEPLLVKDIDDCFIDAEWFTNSKEDRFSNYIRSARQAEKTKIDRVVVMTPDDMSVFMMSLLDSYSFLKGQGGTGSHFDTDKKFFELSESERRQWMANSFAVSVAITDGKRLILVNPEGYDYARYVGVGNTEELLKVFDSVYDIKFHQEHYLDMAIAF